MEKDGPEMAALSSRAAEQMHKCMRQQGMNIQQAESATEQFLIDEGIPIHLIEIALLEAIAMMPWTWKDKRQ